MASPDMEGMIDRAILKGFCSTAQFCGLCDTILDWKTIVVAQRSPSSGLRGWAAMCGTCWAGLPKNTRMLIRSDFEVTLGPEVSR